MESVEKTTSAKIYKGELVATAQPPLYSFLAPFFAEVDKIDLYYFKYITLKSYIAYEHMAGQALSYYMDGAELVLETSDDAGKQVIQKHVVGLTYINGRSEIMRGKQTVSSVLLAKLRFTTPTPNPMWATHIPEIYKRYTLLSESAKKPLDEYIQCEYAHSIL
jgi:hypothetical protein